jgi:serine/threonine protein kinase
LAYNGGMETVGGRYALDGRLGEGGMGHVFRAKHIQLGKPFALKIISPAFAGDNIARARFNQEAKLASEISHPNIVSVVDFGEDPQYGAYMVMELVEGDSLVAAGMLPMGVKRALDVLAQVADALEHIHKRGIIHGDVKADNIMLTAEQSGNSPEARRRRVVRLLDFGLARRPEPGDGEEGISGSPHYIAPERAAGGPVSVSSDIYALGVLGYLLLTGTLPFDGGVMEVLMAHIHNPVEPMSKRRGEEIDEAIENLIGRALAKDPAERHGSAAAFRYELNTVMDMLDMGRRRSSARGSGMMEAASGREALLQMAFERSRIPQALLSIEGTMSCANRAFNKLVSMDEKGVEGLPVTDLSIATYLPGLLRALRTVHTEGKPSERRAKVYRGSNKAPLELTIWLTPLPIPGQEIHMLVRVEEIDPRRSSPGTDGQ